MPSLIVLFGPQQAGKTTTSNELVKKLGFIKVSFADPLYFFAAHLLGVSPEEIRNLPKEEPRVELEGKSIRRTLQTLGTEWGRDMMGQDIWLNNAVRRIKQLQAEGKHVVVDDCRFTNEFAAMRGAGGMMVKINRPKGPAQSAPTHGSEQDWKLEEPDFVLWNDHDSEDAFKAFATRVLLEQIEARVLGS